MAGRERALQAGSGPYMEVHPTTKHYYHFSSLQKQKAQYFLTHDTEMTTVCLQGVERLVDQAILIPSFFLCSPYFARKAPPLVS